LGLILGSVNSHNIAFQLTPTVMNHTTLRDTGTGWLPPDIVCQNFQISAETCKG
jgi:hypothetical protein